MRRMFHSTVFGIVLVTFVTSALIATTLRAQSKPTAIPTAVTVSNGRWQVVNGRPEATATIMLIDTATGNTWIFCDTRPDDAQGWCRMSVSER